MSLNSKALAAELRSLRGGQATRHLDLLRRLGPCLKQLCGVTDDDTALTARNKIGNTVRTLLRVESTELQLAALAALALHPEADHKLLTARTRWLAGKLVCDERTARRRIDEAFARLASAAERQGVDRPEPDERSLEDDGWYVRSFRVVLRLDTPTPEAIEHRVIGFIKDGIEKIIYRFSLARTAGRESFGHDLKAEALYGVRLGERERPIPEHFRFHLELPRAFQAGEQHEYGLLLRVPSDQPMRPYYVYTPYRRCDLFDLTVRFDPRELPRVVWRLTDAVLPMIESDEPNHDILPIDGLGEVRITFRHLKCGLGYGLRWHP